MGKRDGKNTELAGRTFHTSDYQGQDQISDRLAITHEQASDSYMEGEIGGKIERSASSEDELTNRGYQ